MSRGDAMDCGQASIPISGVASVDLLRKIPAATRPNRSRLRRRAKGNLKPRKITGPPRKQRGKKNLPVAGSRPLQSAGLPAGGTSSALCALQTQVLFGGWRSGLAWKWRPDDAAVLVKLHTQREAHLHQYIFDFVERLAAEVLGLEHFVFAFLHEFANGLDVRILQAVVGTDRKLELFDGTIKMFKTWIVREFGRRFDDIGRLFEVDEDAHVILDEFGGEANRVIRRDGAVGPHFDHQFFVVRHLSETRGFNGVVDLAHGRVNAVNRDVADGQIFIVVAVGSDIAAAVLDAHFDLELAAFADSRYVYALVEHREIGIFFNLR